MYLKTIDQEFAIDRERVCLIVRVVVVIVVFVVVFLVVIVVVV